MIAFLSKMFYNTLDCTVLYTGDFFLARQGLKHLNTKIFILYTGGK